MIKHYPQYFSSESQWLENRNKTFFKSLQDVRRYQEWRLNFLSAHYKVDVHSARPLMQVPDLVYEDGSVERFRSGTTSVVADRSYHYSAIESFYVEQHHIWKIEKSHSLQQPGTVIWICSKDYDLIGGSQVKRIFGPKKYDSLGKNTVYELFYNQNFGRDEWKYNLDLMKTDFQVKYVRTSPSVIETMYYYFGDSLKFDFPVMLSEETLNPDVRKMADSMFNGVIDKMMCWDGCLGWFECPHGTKHIYDEFCFVEELEDGILASTDLNNLASPFIRYISGDRGSVGQIDCKCGISGNYFKSFEGKVIEALYVENDGGKLIPGRFVSEKLSVLLRTGQEFSHEAHAVEFDPGLVYKLRQRTNLDIEFIYSARVPLASHHQEKIVALLEKIVWRSKNCKAVSFVRVEPSVFFEKETRRTKSLFIESDYVRDMWKQKRIRDESPRLF